MGAKAHRVTGTFALRVVVLVRPPAVKLRLYARMLIRPPAVKLCLYARMLIRPPTVKLRLYAHMLITHPAVKLSRHARFAARYREGDTLLTATRAVRPAALVRGERRRWEPRGCWPRERKLLVGRVLARQPTAPPNRATGAAGPAGRPTAPHARRPALACLTAPPLPRGRASANSSARRPSSSPWPSNRGAPDRRADQQCRAPPVAPLAEQQVPPDRWCAAVVVALAEHQQLRGPPVAPSRARR